MSEVQRRAWICAALVALSLAARPLPAGPSGEEIAREADRRQRSRSQYYDGRIEVIDRKGRVREKAWRYRRLGYGGEAKTLIQFVSPPEVKGVGLLTWVHSGKADEQWMWTPAIRRDRRIGRQDRSSRFLGTDFTYEDLSQRVLDDWRYRMEEETGCGEETCWIVEAVPRETKESQYSRTRIWFRQRDYATLRMEMYEGDALRRTLVLSEHRIVGGIVTPHRLVMSDHKRESRTILTLSDVRHDVHFPEEIFTIRGLHEIHAPP